MEQPASNSQAFVIRIWLEETASDGCGAKWRGHITHTETRTQQYIEDLGKIDSFIASYLVAMGVKFKLRQRLALWLNGA